MTINHNLLQIRQWLVKVMKLFRQGDGIVGCLPVFFREIHHTLFKHKSHFRTYIHDTPSQSGTFRSTKIKLKG